MFGVMIMTNVLYVFIVCTLLVTLIYSAFLQK